MCIRLLNFCSRCEIVLYKKAQLHTTGGTAGCVLACRLSENPKNKVLSNLSLITVRTLPPFDWPAVTRQNQTHISSSISVWRSVCVIFPLNSMNGISQELWP
jgi:hypothetical protein